VEPHARDRGQADAVQAAQEVQVPEVAPQLAVGHDGEAQRFLPGDARADAAVLDLAQGGEGKGAGASPGAGLVQLGRAQQAPDLFGSKWRCGRHPDSSR
jgi:hypothetical protein